MEKQLDSIACAIAQSGFWMTYQRDGAFFQVLIKYQDLKVSRAYDTERNIGFIKYHIIKDCGRIMIRHLETALKDA